MLSWVGLTDFGDSAAMLPAAALIALWLAAGRAWHQATLWCIGFALSATLVALSKIAFLGWGIGIEVIDFTGISGHAMLAVAVLSVGAAVSLHDRGRAIQLAGAALGAIGGVCIGLSRLVLHFHSLSEVLVGGVVGACLAASFIWGGRHANAARLQPALLGALLLLTFATIHGERAPTEALLTRVALTLSGRPEPYSHAIWRAAAAAPSITSAAPIGAGPP
jgi:membrane-associated phospholipid phosphatase